MPARPRRASHAIARSRGAFGGGADTMDRRRFVMTSLVAAVDWPLAAGAQQAAKVYRVGYLASGTAAANARQHTAFIDGLRDSGWIEGKNITIEYRWDETDGSRLDALAAELARLPLDVLF